MNSKLFISLSMTALLSVSVIAYGKLYPRDGIPQSDCLEMDCPSGVCMEDEKFEGFCCPETMNLPKFGETCTECGCNGAICKLEPGKSKGGRCVECLTDNDCEGNLVCLPDGVCGCAEGSTLYTKIDNTRDCCVNSTHVIADVEGSTNKVCCPKETPKWDSVQQKCVACLLTTDCEDNQVCTPEKTCGCSAGMTSYTKPDGTTSCCSNTEMKLVTSGNAKVCCPLDSKLPTYDEACDVACGCFDQATTGLTCSATTNKCACPENYGWDDKNKKCLPYCAANEEFGAIFVIDRSGSTTSSYYKKINNALNQLTLYPDIFYAVFEQNSSSKGWNRLGWARQKNINNVSGIFSNYKTGGGTSFTNAFTQIKDICSRSAKVKIVYFLITDGKITSDMNALQSLESDINSKCENASFVLISKETKQTNKLSPIETCDTDGDLSSCISHFNKAVEREICIQR